TAELVEYGVVGRAVNLASRVEGLTRVHGVDILVTRAGGSALDGRFRLRALPAVEVKGLPGPLVTDAVEGCGRGEPAPRSGRRRGGHGEEGDAQDRVRPEENAECPKSRGRTTVAGSPPYVRAASPDRELHLDHAVALLGEAYDLAIPDRRSRRRSVAPTRGVRAAQRGGGCT